MKRIIVLATAAIAVASCAKVNTGTPSPKVEPTPVDTPVFFEAYNYVSSTKAATNPTKFYPGGSFNVYSFYSTTVWADLADELPSTAKFIDGEPVSYSDNAWRTETTYYWPKVGTLSFFAYYPSSVTATVTKKSEGVKFTDYAVLEKLAAQYANDRVTTDSDGAIVNDLNDVLVADPALDQTANQKNPYEYFTNGVPMLFRHTLAKVKLQAKQAKTPDTGVVPGDFRIIINNISIDNIHYKGSYSSAATANVWTASASDVLVAAGENTAHKNSGNFVEGMTNSGRLSGDDNKKTIGSNEFFKFDATYALPLFYADETSTPKVENNYLTLGNEYYVLPQALDNLSNLLVSYTVFALDDEGFVLSSQDYENVAVQLNTIDYNIGNATRKIDTWKINGFYTYRLLLSPYGEPVLFDPAVSAWDTVVSDPYTIYSE